MERAESTPGRLFEAFNSECQPDHPSVIHPTAAGQENFVEFVQVLNRERCFKIVLDCYEDVKLLSMAGNTRRIHLKADREDQYQKKEVELKPG